MREDVLAALPVRRGHFLLESGYHADTWLTLDALFADPEAVAPLVAALAGRLRPYELQGVCGPLLGGAFLAQAIASSIGVRFYYSELVASSDAALLVTKYQLPVALRSLVRGERVAVVDDVISAGSSVRATVAALTDAGASISAVAAFMVLGDVGWDHFVGHGMPIETLQRRKFEVWAPEQCPSCRSGTKLEDPREPASPSVS